eukprot:TRINITY_DN7778_c0_g1_i2.p1 TRINITY_DN7778_c0_g1~~TRINITY_DN7778_c0_g1_i2.p1  ORF type:complete len:190 (+),score=53.48 TRINITY_DN7778_c0_g1_i2:78-647(+)
MIRRPPRSTLSSSSAASDVYKRQLLAHPHPHHTKEVAEVVPAVALLRTANTTTIAMQATMEASHPMPIISTNINTNISISPPTKIMGATTATTTIVLVVCPILEVMTVRIVTITAVETMEMLVVVVVEETTPNILIIDINSRQPALTHHLYRHRHHPDAADGGDYIHHHQNVEVEVVGCWWCCRVQVVG